MEYLILDIGGSNLRAGRYCSERNILVDEVYSKTDNYLVADNKSQQQILEKLSNQCGEIGRGLFPTALPAGVVVGFPSPIDQEGNCLAMPTLCGKTQIISRVCEFFQKNLWAYQVPTVLINDVTAAGYRYLRSGIDFCIITVGSGIGNKIFINGKQVVGVHGRGGEIGHLRIDNSVNALVCDCGEIGHLGGIASGRGALSFAKHRADKDRAQYNQSLLSVQSITTLSTEDLVEAFAADDAWTKEIISYSASLLGQQIASIHLNLGIEDFVIVGGFAKALGDKYIEMLAFVAKQSCLDTGQDWLDYIKLGHQDDRDGLIGGGIYAKQYFEVDLDRLRFKNTLLS